jgi:FixJ family two-component response regulator
LTDRWDGSVFNLIKHGDIDGFLIKPLSKKELIDKIDAFIDE